MKKRNLIAVAGVVVLLAACIPSVNPFYTDKDVVYNQSQVGEWQEKDETNNPEMWTFEQSTNNGYKLTVVEHGKTGEFTAHLFKLKQEQFLDLIPSKCEFATNQADLVNYSIFPGHLIARMPQVEPNLKLAFCDFDWLQKYLEKNPGALAHHMEGNGIILTADTRDLQKFVLKHVGTNELFKEYGEMVRGK
jgi:hypothetical protein